MEKYKEILELYEHCKKNGIEVELEELYDGYAIRFKNGADFVQHKYSYDSNIGCVEPAAVDDEYDYTAVDLNTAKKLVDLHKAELKEGVV